LEFKGFSFGQGSETPPLEAAMTMMQTPSQIPSTETDGMMIELNKGSGSPAHG
jgi:hypothetical protein